MDARPRRRHLAIVALVAALAACSGGGGDDAADTTEAGELSPVPDPLESLAEPTPGQGVAVIGIEELSFTVTTCTEGPRPEDTPEATLDYLVEGTGESSDGPFVVEVSRYRSDTGVGDPVITETARIAVGVGDDARGIEAKRTTAGGDGAWLDLADPDASTALIERRSDAYDVRGTFGPEGASARDEGLEAGRLRASCPPVTAGRTYAGDVVTEADTAVAGRDPALPDGGPADGPVPPPWWARLVVVVVLVVIAVAFVVPVKFTFWPVTSWELFSRVRSPDQAGWEVRMVDAAGDETPIPFSRLGPGHQRWLLVARTLPSRTDADRVRVCQTWADAAAATLGPDAVREVRAYEVVRRAADRIQDPPRVVERDLYVDCVPS